MEITAGETFSLLTGLAILAALGYLISGPFISAVGGAVGEGLSRSDRVRTAAAVTGLTGLGSASKVVVLDNSYKAIDVGDGRITLKTGDESSEVPLPDEFSYSAAGDISGTDICLRKDGTDYTVFSKTCDDTGCPEDACSTIPRGETDVPRRGFHCRGNVYTSDGFYRHYYTSDAAGCGGGDVGDDFIQVNRFSCPDTVGRQTLFGCTATVTWRCDSGDARVDVPASDDGPVSAGCTDSVRHKRFFFSLSPGSGEYTVSVTAELTASGDETTVSRTIQVRAY